MLLLSEQTGSAVLCCHRVSCLVFTVLLCACVQTGELEYPKEEQSFTLRQRLQNFVTGRVAPSPAGKGATASGSKGVPSGSH